MRKLLITFFAALSLLALPVHADRGYGHRGGYGHHGGGSVAAGLAIFGVLTGLAILSEQNRQSYVDPYYARPAYVPPPVYVEQSPDAVPAANQAGTWYYCASSAMYYPYTRDCPEGWQAVQAQPY